MSIQDVLKLYEAALNGNDVAAILGLYGREPFFIAQNAPALDRPDSTAGAKRPTLRGDAGACPGDDRDESGDRHSKSRGVRGAREWFGDPREPGCVKRSVTSA